MSKSNIYSKLQKARSEFSEKQLKKSGHNTFAKFKYFELGDFVPTIIHLLEKNGLYSHTTYNDDFTVMSLTIINVENPEEKLVWSRPAVQAEASKQSIQNSGATDTYHRRYLWLMAFEIVENDMVDSTSGEDQPKQKEKNQKTKVARKLIQKQAVEEIQQLIQSKEVDEKAVMYFVTSNLQAKGLEDLDEQQAKILIETLNKKPNKAKQDDVF